MAGSLRTALFNRLSNTVTSLFMQVMCSLDRNDNLLLYWKQKDSRLRSLWVKIFLDPSLFPLQHSPSFENNHQRYDVISDGNRGPFECMFPFSFLFVHAIESMREEATRINATNPEDAIDRLIKSTFGTFWETSVDPEWIIHYLSDYVGVYGSNTSLSFQHQFEITKNILIRASQNKVSNWCDTLLTFQAFCWSSSCLPLEERASNSTSISIVRPISRHVEGFLVTATKTSVRVLCV